MFKTERQSNSDELNKLLLSSDYYKAEYLDCEGDNATWEFIEGINDFMPKLLKYFTHIDTRVLNEKGDIRLQGWFKSDNDSDVYLPGCVIRGYDNEHGIFIGSMLIEKITE